MGNSLDHKDEDLNDDVHVYIYGRYCLSETDFKTR